MTTLAFVFPGQGSQAVGMLADLAERFPIVLQTFNQVSERLGYDIWQLVQQGPLEKLNQTQYTQVAMLAADVAVFRVIQEMSAAFPTYMAGHSLGEYAALVCAEAISLEDAATLVAARGRLMQQAMPMGEGAMAAIVGLTEEQVADLCAKASTDDSQVSPANYNAIGQVVIAGHTQAVERAIILANEQQARLATRIPVSVPCHCSLLQDAAQAFEPFLQEAPFKQPKTAVISNVDLAVYETPVQIRSLLKEQLYKPVRWVETIQKMQMNQVDLIIECGPGKVLSGLIKRIDRALSSMCVYDQQSLEAALPLLKANEYC